MTFGQLLLLLAMVAVAAAGIAFLVLAGALLGSIARHPFRRDPHLAARHERRAAQRSAAARRR